jgi:hypothetical protein
MGIPLAAICGKMVMAKFAWLTHFFHISPILIISPETPSISSKINVGF